MASQHVYSLLSQTLAAPEDLAVADAGETSGMGSVLLLRWKAQRWDSHEERS